MARDKEGRQATDLSLWFSALPFFCGHARLFYCSNRRMRAYIMVSSVSSVSTGWWVSLDISTVARVMHGNLSAILLPPTMKFCYYWTHKASQRLYIRALYTYTLSNGTYLHSQNIKLTHKVYFQYAIHYKRHHMNRKEHGYYSPCYSRKYIKSAVWTKLTVPYEFIYGTIFVPNTRISQYRNQWNPIDFS